MMGRLRAAALLLALGAACTRGEEQDGESGICRHLPQAYCRDDRPVTTRCQYESIAYCIEYVPKGELVAAPDEAKRLCEEVPYLDATGRFEAGDCPGGAVGRCTSEPSYGRRDYY
ncbi:MAG: hypothetical protein IT376_22255, partial [Polyangiaceae bacterium]|nr:hypothetical protein [Polyangiaceae bacterium]